MFRKLTLALGATVAIAADIRFCPYARPLPWPRPLGLGPGHLRADLCRIRLLLCETARQYAGRPPRPPHCSLRLIEQIVDGR